MKNPDNQENNTSTAAALIRAQGEQMRRMTAEEYLTIKTGSDEDGQKKPEKKDLG